jgi:hypothetical protein
MLARPIDADSVATHIVDAVVSAIEKRRAKESKGFDPPSRHDNEGAFAWMRRVLEDASRYLGNSRLLIILDEFTALCWHEEHHFMDPSVFDNLRATMAALREINWLLIAQDYRFHDQALWGNAAQIFKRARPLKLSRLDDSWARRLLVEPMTRSGIVYEHDELVDQLINLTGGSPYFINWIGELMLSRLNKLENEVNYNTGRPRVITREIVDEVTEEFTQYCRDHFQHLLNHLAGIKRVLLVLIAVLNREWVYLAELRDALHTCVGSVREDTVRSGLEALERYGAITTQRDDDGSERMTIILDPLHQWLQDDINLDDIVNEWQRGKHSAGEAAVKEFV